MRNVAFLLALMLAVTVPASAQEDDPCAGIDGTVGALSGTWSEPFSVGDGGTGVGSQASWDEHDISDPLLIAYLDSITITVEWTNELTGAADFGVAIGTADGFYYENNPQAATGAQSDSITFSRSTLVTAGWTEEDLRIGPSISTGGGSVDGIDYALSWVIDLSSARCADPALVPEGTNGPPGNGGGGLANSGGGIPVQWWIAVGLVGAAFIALMVYATRK